MGSPSAHPMMLRMLVAVMLSLRTVAVLSQAGASYADAIELFRRGDDELALKQLTAMTDSDITVGRDALFKAFTSPTFAKANRAALMMRAAAVLHTVRAFAARAHNDVREFQYHFRFARSYIDMLMANERSATSFVKTWQLFVISSYHGQVEVQAAREFSRGARDRPGDSPLLLLALGATEEMGWWLHQQEDAPSSVDGDLKEAERDYRQALVIEPTLIEARLRLGRVLALRKDDEAATVLGQIGDAIELPYPYLARLFEGDRRERAGNLAGAEEQYLAAVKLMSEPQSAFMALAHVRHARGARAEAAQDVRVTTGPRDVIDTADPWFWYARGTAWRRLGYLDDLRKMMAP